MDPQTPFTLQAQQQQQQQHDPAMERIARETAQLTAEEIFKLKELLHNSDLQSLAHSPSVDSDYPEFTESTHAWAVFADNPQKRAGSMERVVGTLIIAFQLFTYWIFAKEAIEDYEKGQVVVMTGHANCLAANEMPEENFICEAEFTNIWDALIAFFMLGIFLTGDFLQVYRVTHAAPNGIALCFALLAGIEVVSAYFAACIAVSYSLYIGEVTDAIEVGVGLLFIRELSQRAYAGIRYGKTKQYRTYFTVLALLVVTGMVMDPLCERWFAVKD